MTQYEVIHADGLDRYNTLAEAKERAAQIDTIMEWITPNTSLVAEIWRWNGKKWDEGFKRKCIKKVYT